MKFFSIDPGLSGTGVTFWGHSEGNPTDRRPTAVYSLRGKTAEDYMAKIASLILKCNPSFIVIEEAEYFSGDERGEVTVRSGSLVKLAMFIGSLRELCRSHKVIFELVTPMRWKGQLSKEIIELRIKRIWPECPATSEHAWDSVGIGFWKIGML